MFTGIIRELGTVTRNERRNGLARLTIQAPRTAAKIEPLESIAVNGVCLSAVRIERGAVAFEVIPETLRMTALAGLRPGARVHVEPSLTLTDRLGGQLLLGHVDGVGRILSRRARGGEVVLEIQVPPALRRWLVPKGPIAVDGVSLTMGARLGRSSFTVHLIPETIRQTTLGGVSVGSPVNLELDYFTKLVGQLASSRSAR